MSDVTSIERADRLKTPPVLGRVYLVPTIRFDWGGYWLHPQRGRWWPVMGLKHDDVEFLSFEPKHYHVDPRFLTRRHWSDISPWPPRTGLDEVMAKPINSTKWPDGPPKPQLRPMECTLVELPYGYGDSYPIQKLNAHFAGQQCPKGKRGFVCPHKHLALGSIAPIDGVITCPLHGLRIDAETGICLGPEAKAA